MTKENKGLTLKFKSLVSITISYDTQYSYYVGRRYTIMKISIN